MFYSPFSSMFQNWLLMAYLSQQQSQNCSLVIENPIAAVVSPGPQGFRYFEGIKEIGSQDTRSRKQSQDQTIDLQKEFQPASKLCGEFKSQNDQDYFPEELSKKKYRKNRQDQNRNVVPNSIHQILSFIQKKSKSLTFVQKAFSKHDHDPTWTVNRFYLYQIKFKESVNHYVNEDTLQLLSQIQEPECAVYSEPEQMFYLKVTRVIVHQFLSIESASIILTSKRMSQDKKRNHLSVRRYLQDKLSAIYGK